MHRRAASYLAAPQRRTHHARCKASSTFLKQSIKHFPKTQIIDITTMSLDRARAMGGKFLR
jgi:hypothetical protein